MKNRLLQLTTVLLICFLIISCQKGHDAVTFIVEVAPPHNTLTSEIFIVGNFNNWSPSDNKFKLKYSDDGKFIITLENLPENIEYKYTRGSWETVEKSKKGNDIENRKLDTRINKIVNDKILSWNSMPIVSTKAENVVILDSAFYIPQLNRNRRIWVYLPPNYNSSDINYPVVYMHDAQNLFDIKTSFAGEWEIDETINQLAESEEVVPIIVGVDNGQENRLNEYSPYTNKEYGGGEGDKYLEFIVETLKPHIDTSFRTLSTAENTAIAGSSMGGLISFYAGVKYQKVFGKIFVFSPSFWFSEEIFDLVEDTQWKNQPKMYFLAGENEGGDMVDDMEKMIDLLKEKGYEEENIKSLIVPAGEHNEKLWRTQWRTAYEWMF